MNSRLVSVAAVLCAMSSAAACSSEDAVVGRNASGGSGGVLIAGTGGAGAIDSGGTTSVGGLLPPGTGGGARLRFTNFGESNGFWIESNPLPGATITYGVEDSAAEDGLAAVLVLPGDPSLTSSEHAGPDLSTQIAFKQAQQFGTTRSRVRFPTCSPDEEVVSAAFAFFNDGTDANGNGLDDNPEIDFQVLCGSPTYIVLTVWSDYERSGRSERFLKTSRAIDTTNGALYDLASQSVHDYVASGSDPDLATPGFPDPATFYEIGFEWHEDLVRFFMKRHGTDVTLWEVDDPAFVPQVPLLLMLNLWHPETHWLPGRDAADYPSTDTAFRLDWFDYRSE